MMAGHRATVGDLDSDPLGGLSEQGYAVVKGVFDPSLVGELAKACDRMMSLAEGRGDSFKLDGANFRIEPDSRLGPVLRLAQWPSYLEAAFDRARLDRRLLDLLRPRLGHDVKQIINQVHWKPPGGAALAFGYHQDIFFRRPPEAYRNPLGSFLQTAIAIDPQNAENGGLTVYPGSHRQGPLDFPERGTILESPLLDRDLVAVGLDPAKAVTLSLEPGDLVVWTLLTVHGSGPNRSSADRRLYINGYARAADCDVGHWVLREGRTCPLPLVSQESD